MGYSATEITELQKFDSAEQLKASAAGWSFSPDKGGVLHIKLKPQKYNAMFVIEIK